MRQMRHLLFLSAKMLILNMWSVLQNADCKNKKKIEMIMFLVESISFETIIIKLQPNYQTIHKTKQ